MRTSMSAHLTLLHLIFLIKIRGQKKNITKLLNVQIRLPSQSVQWLGSELNNQKSRVDSRQGQEIFLVSETVCQSVPGTHPASYAKRTGRSFPRV